VDTWLCLYSQAIANLTLVNTPEPLPWTSEIKTAFASIKQALSQAPALGLPDFTKPFILFCHEKDRFALAVLTQTHEDKHCPVAYYSSALDPGAARFPPCLRAVAAAAVTVELSSTLILENLSKLLSMDLFHKYQIKKR
uniref:Reverse transcriptase/retrotransposon-derived protein RNase H-like domain-containing protein n=1 Tax=Crocodylus porosus TaxID=8502 RepID=A0A7M4FI07_CROPO